jgi:hypothetical protein
MAGCLIMPIDVLAVLVVLWGNHGSLKTCPFLDHVVICDAVRTGTYAGTYAGQIGR